jgi:hypothetical protein
MVSFLSEQVRRPLIPRSHGATALRIGLCLGLTAGLWAPGAIAAPDNQPRMEVRETTQDGGVVEEGTLVKYRFVVLNRGDADLELKRVMPDCGCSIAHWEKVVPPGGQSAIEAEMHTELFRGRATKHLTVISNDPTQKELTLTITARVTPLVEVTPDRAALLSMQDQPVRQEFTVERNGQKPMQVLRVMPNAPYLKAEAAPLPGVGRYRLTVTTTPDTPMGRSVVPVVVQTDLPTASLVTLYLTVDRGIVTVPPMVFYGLLPLALKAPSQAAVTLSRRAQPFHIKAISVDDPKLAAKLETVREGEEYRITVTYAGGWETGLVRKTLTVTTDDPKQPVFRIPIQALIQTAFAGSVVVVK